MAGPLPVMMTLGTRGLRHSSRGFLTPSICPSHAAPKAAFAAASSLLSRVRHASSMTSSAPPAAAAPASAPRSAAASPMEWNKFFQLRTSRRRYSVISSIIGALFTTTTTMYVLVEHQDQAENILKLVPTDPIVSTGIAVVAATFLGWLLGPVAGNGVWRLVHRQGLAEFTVKEKAFFERIKRHRVNPSGAGANNPVPDFYGEKIGSVAGYRRWLKDQRAFNRKRRGNYAPATSV